ncbi:MAG: lytic transglycosylase domain-containing protein [Sandaracinaceae bacterium]|nr:lytic transglycosylase domain-containing protein [Sandaracinaceae bacterium]
MWLARRHLAAFLEQPPAGEHYARWRIAYPQAYAPLIEEAAEARALPPELVRAIAREESSFRADAVSVAHAYGLTQLIVPTARRFGRSAGVPISAQTLTDPRVNVTVGAEFMAWLWGRYESNPAVLPSAYNAGQGATDRWLRERPRQRLDEWIEDIPYDETRRYSRRVLQSWGIYAWLDRGELPELRASLPAAP